MHNNGEHLGVLFIKIVNNNSYQEKFFIPIVSVDGIEPNRKALIHFHSDIHYEVYYTRKTLSIPELFMPLTSLNKCLETWIKVMGRKTSLGHAN